MMRYFANRIFQPWVNLRCIPPATSLAWVCDDTTAYGAASSANGGVYDLRLSAVNAACLEAST